MLLKEWKKRGTFTCCGVLVPGEIPNWTLYVLTSRNRKKKSNFFFFPFFFSFLFFLPLKLEPKRASTRLRGGRRSDEYLLDRLPLGSEGMNTVGMRVRVHECVCWRVNGQLVNTFLGTKLFLACSVGKCTKMLCVLLEKQKKTRKKRNQTSRCVDF